MIGSEVYLEKYLESLEEEEKSEKKTEKDMTLEELGEFLEGVPF